MLTGGCFCGAIRYQLSEPLLGTTLCHCVDCRRASGAPVVAWLTVPRASLRFVGGEPEAYASNPAVRRQFCPDCGTQLTWHHDRAPDSIDVATGSLDDPEQAAPTEHTWMSQRVSWLHVNDDLPQYLGAEADDGPDAVR